jgi:NAD(P)-dependent dehydrogenase (short-subunit alcohol dehydrogenase family)
VSDFQGRVAIVSGASSGIGEATALRLGRDAVDLVLLASAGDREDLARVQDQLHAMGARAVTLAGDVSEPMTARSAVQTAMTEFGHLDYLVNNAGIIGHHGFFEETIEEFDRMMAVNARGAYLLAPKRPRRWPTAGRSSAPRRSHRGSVKSSRLPTTPPRAPC